jgi:hypothetical protein
VVKAASLVDKAGSLMDKAASLMDKSVKQMVKHDNLADKAARFLVSARLPVW